MQKIQAVLVGQLKVISCAIEGIAGNVANDIVNKLGLPPKVIVKIDGAVDSPNKVQAVVDRRPEFYAALSRAQFLIDEAIQLLEPFENGVGS